MAITPTSTTGRQLITMALKICGALGEGQSVGPEDYQDALRLMNWMLAQWRRKRWMVYHLLDKSLVSTGAQNYTIGPGGVIDITPRPDKLEAAYFRQLVSGGAQPNNVDYPLDIITSYEEYSRIPLKQLSSFSYSIFYDNKYPLGLLYPWPIPQASIYEVHVLVKDVLQRFNTLDSEVILPEEYEPALAWNLSTRLAPIFTLSVTQDMKDVAKDAMNVIREANAQIDVLQIPEPLIRPGIYDPYSDQTR